MCKYLQEHPGEAESIEYREDEHKITASSIQTIVDWLVKICTEGEIDEAFSVTIPISIDQSWRSALEVRMTAITMGMGGYAKRIENAWLRKGIARKDLFEDGLLVFKTARQGEGVYDKSD